MAVVFIRESWKALTKLHKKDSGVSHAYAIIFLVAAIALTLNGCASPNTLSDLAESEERENATAQANSTSGESTAEGSGAPTGNQALSNKSLVLDASLSAAGTDAEGIEDWSAEYVGAILEVRNESADPLIFASFVEFLDQNDESVWRTVTFSFWQLASGETTVVPLGLDSMGASDVNERATHVHWYVISKEDPNAGKQTSASSKQSLGNAVDVDETEVNESGATITVHNARSDQVSVESITLIATTDDGTASVTTKELDSPVTVDESADLTFDADEVFAGMESLANLNRFYFAESGGLQTMSAPTFWVGDPMVDSVWDALTYVPLLPEDFE